MFDQESGPLVTNEPIGIEIPKQESMINFIQQLDPVLFEKIEIEPEPYVLTCVKPGMVKADTREERMQQMMELPRLYKEFNKCKEREEEERFQWDHAQEISVPLRIIEEK